MTDVKSGSLGATKSTNGKMNGTWTRMAHVGPVVKVRVPDLTSALSSSSPENNETKSLKANGNGTSMSNGHANGKRGRTNRETTFLCFFCTTLLLLEQLVKLTETLSFPHR